MSQARDPAVRSPSRPPRPPKPSPTSFSGFFGRLLPRNRPEQGGTTRVQGDTGDDDSADTDLGINPNELTQWNFARERTLKMKAVEASLEAPHRRDRSWSFRQSTGFDGDMQDVQQLPPLLAGIDITRARRSGPATPPKAPEGPSTREEIAKTLRAKEESRKNRRDLIESGDWLGVQGADPHSGEFAVLTPTTTISSDTTPPSTKKRLAKLSRKKKEARIAYERVKMEEELERERIVMGKERSKLQKMQRAKDEAQQKQDLPTWSKHRCRWSSAAEPDLSPIAQSVNSINVAESSSEHAAVAICNFSRPSRSNGGSVSSNSKHVEVSGNSRRIEPPRQSHKPDHQQSTETIVRRALPNRGSPDMSIKPVEALRSPNLLLADDTPPQRHKSKKHFLWPHRRRMTDPGKLTKSHGFITTHSLAGKTQDNLVSASTEIPPLPKLRSTQEQEDHFADLQIPDCLFRLACLENTEQADISSSNSWARVPLKSTLKVTTNLSESRSTPAESGRPQSEIDAATAISSQSKPTGTRKSRRTHRSPVPIRSSSSQVGIEKRETTEPQILKPDRGWNGPDTDLTAIWVRDNVRLPLVTQENPELQSAEALNSETSMDANRTTKTAPGVSASILITTTTGSAPKRLDTLNRTQARTLTRRKGTESLVGTEGALAILSSRADDLLYTKLATELGRGQTSFQSPTLQSDSQNSKPALEIADLGTSSADPATPETGAEIESEVEAVATSQLQKLPASGQRLCNSLMKLVQERLEAVGVSMRPAHPDEDQGKGKEEVNEQIQGLRTEADEVESLVSGQTRLRPASNENTGRFRAIREMIDYQHRHEEAAMIQEAARVAMQRSRAQEVDTTRSRTPSPRTSKATVNGAVPLKPRTDPRRPKRVLRGENGGSRSHNSHVDGDIDSLSSRMDSLGCRGVLPRVPRQYWLRLLAEDREQEHEKGGQTGEGRAHYGKEEPEEDPEHRADAAVALVSVFCVACVILIRLGSVWWVTVSPAFDDGSAIRRRQREGVGTWRDLGVFVGAALFCVAGVGVVTLLTSAMFM